jgi:hypothetical protein
MKTQKHIDSLRKIIKDQMGYRKEFKNEVIDYDSVIMALSCALYKQFTRKKWPVDLNNHWAIDVKLFKIGQELCEK